MQSDRRAHPRIDASRAGKLYDHRSRKYLPFTMCNISRSGAMIELKTRWPVSSGDRLMLGVAAGARQALLTSMEMLEVEVIRTLPTTEGRTGIAVRFVHADDIMLNLSKLAA